MFVWTVPDELCTFINRQFLRFQAPFPSERALNEVGDIVLNYVSSTNYFPKDYSEALWRYNNPQAGLTEPEKFSLITRAEFRVKVKMLETISFEQIHLAVWASLMWCWTEEGVKHVKYIQARTVSDQATGSDCSFNRNESAVYQMV